VNDHAIAVEDGAGKKAPSIRFADNGIIIQMELLISKPDPP
jgi:hypothetical protein